MTDARQLIDELAALGVKVELNDGKIKFGPKSKVMPELLLKMREQRGQLIAYLEDKQPDSTELVTLGAFSKPEVQAIKSHGGLRQLPFFLIGFCMTFLFIWSSRESQSSYSYDPYESALSSYYSSEIFRLKILLSLPVFFRLKNMRWKPYLVLLIFVPVVDMFMGLVCLFQPEGHAEENRPNSVPSSG